MVVKMIKLLRLCQENICVLVHVERIFIYCIYNNNASKYVGRERKIDGIKMIIIYVAKVCCRHLQEMQEAQLNTSNVEGEDNVDVVKWNLTNLNTKLQWICIYYKILCGVRIHGKLNTKF
jgi:hypothetical protein